jgi:hypothetical protein
LKGAAPNVSSAVDAQYPLSDLMFRNDTSGEMRNITSAVEPSKSYTCADINKGERYYGWFGRCDCLELDDDIYGWFCLAEVHYWDPEWGVGGGFRTRAYNSPFENVINWEGYFIRPNSEEISMVVMI